MKAFQTSFPHTLIPDVLASLTKRFPPQYYLQEPAYTQRQPFTLLTVSEIHLVKSISNANLGETRPLWNEGTQGCAALPATMHTAEG